MYSPKVSEKLIPDLYKMAKKRGIPMTILLDRILRKVIEEELEKEVREDEE